jgi:CheY-like chemotaxis protein
MHNIANTLLKFKPVDQDHVELEYKSSASSSSSDLFLLNEDMELKDTHVPVPLSHRGLSVLIVADLDAIRLGVLRLLNNAFLIENNYVSVDIEKATNKLRLDKKNFDIVVVERNVYDRQSEATKLTFESLLQNRERLSIMVEPDCDYLVQNQSIDESWLHHIPFPLPSADQLRAGLVTSAASSSDSFIKSIIDIPRASSYRKTDTTFEVLLVCSSNTCYKMMTKQLSNLLEEMDIPYRISVASDGIDALDKCGNTMMDLIIVDNAFKASDMHVCESLEFLRHQMTTSSTLIVVLSKSAITNTSTLVDAGADVIWPKPLPDKETLKNRLSRICKYYKF